MATVDDSGAEVDLGFEYITRFTQENPQIVANVLGAAGWRVVACHVGGQDTGGRWLEYGCWTILFERPRQPEKPRQPRAARKAKAA